MKLLLVGMGTGNPEHLTLEAVRRLREVDLVLMPDKGTEKAELAVVRHDILSRVFGDGAPQAATFAMPKRDPDPEDYTAEVARWHAAIADSWQAAIDRAGIGPGGTVALLVWGDPSLYDSTLRIAAILARSRPVAVEVIPGITSVQALTAAHGVPLNPVGGPVAITTGRRLREDGWPEGFDRVVVMLDGKASFQALDPAGITIRWTAYAGMPGETSLAGPLADLAPVIVETRARLRRERGWIMDIYLLERTGRD